MFLRAAAEYNIDLSKSIMIGDKESDRIELPELRSIILKGEYPLSGNSLVCESVDEIIKDLGWKDE